MATKPYIIALEEHYLDAEVKRHYSGTDSQHAPRVTERLDDVGQGRIAEMDEADRQAYLVDRVISCKVSDLGVTFVTRIGPNGGAPVREANGSEAPAQVRFTAKSDDLIAIAADPTSIGRAWLTGRLKVEASIWDILRLRKVL